jgi:hypothetical protein
LISFRACLMHKGALQNKDLAMKNLCHAVCSDAVRCLAARQHQDGIRVILRRVNVRAVYQKRVESCIVYAEQKQKVQHPVSRAAKNSACHDEDGPEEATDRAHHQLPCHAYTPPAPSNAPALRSQVQEPTVPTPSSPLASLPSTFGSTLLLSCSSKKARSSRIFIIARSRRILRILASSFAASTSSKRRLSWMHFL